MIDPTAAGHGWFVDPTPLDDTEFSDQDGGTTQKKIENYLAGALGGDKPTHTM